MVSWLSSNSPGGLAHALQAMSCTSVFALLGVVGFAGGCGTSTGAGTKSQPDFSLTAGASSLTLTAGAAAQTVSLSATALNGFSGTVQVTTSGLPAGVTATPSSLTLTPGTPQTISVAAAASAASTTATVQFTATAAALSHSASVSVTVKQPIVVTPGVDVTTYHFDIARTGLNPNETTLTPANVTSSKFGLLRVLAVDGKVDAQPLYLSNLTVAGQQHNVVFAATEHDSVYAFNADTGAQLWKTSILGANETTSGDHGCGQISPEIGITSTPVIDRKRRPQRRHLRRRHVAGSGGAYHQRLHALDVTTGAELSGSPTEIRRHLSRHRRQQFRRQMSSSIPASMPSAPACCCSTAPSTWAGPRTAISGPTPAG